MASPSNASEPESPDEEEIIEAGFDPLYFWDQYRQVILLAGGIILLGLVGFGIYEYNVSQRIAAAGAALAEASTEDDYRAVMDKYPGTVAAGNASLFLGAKLRQDRKYDDSLQVLQDFMDKYPNHPLLPAGDLSYAETLEAQGKVDDALARYEEVAAKYPDSYSAPVAVIAQANILKVQGKIDEARRLYENFVAQFPDSIFTQEAMAEMHMLRPVTAPPSVEQAVKQDLFNAVRANAASPSPAASAAPVLKGTPVPPAAAPVPLTPGTSSH
jgi:TolA-binding protein